MYNNKACAAQFSANVDSQGGGWWLQFSQGAQCASTQVSHFKMSMYIDFPPLTFTDEYTQSYVMVNGSLTQLTVPFSTNTWMHIDVPLNSTYTFTGQTQFAFYPPLDTYFPWSATIYIDDLAFY